MEFLIIYLIVAAVVAIFGTFALVVPTVSKLLDTGIENQVTENRYLLYPVGFVLMFLIAPMIVMILYNYEHITAARDALYQELK